MTMRTISAAGALTLGLSVATAAAAHGVGGFICQTFNMAKNTPPTTHCVTWTKEAAEHMREAPCDPSKMSAAEMRQRCAEMSAASATPSNG
ncbi:hypothetical protein [Phenylobacterium montanum]|uniref:3',5'-cyclic-nucleotide phosphodiesterase n=1 Tax=Phenylobacterium montanum TaxID=2823693 RepID=A0A975IXC8_9CAUL|nr:hypothetical protein [Caulobacter sp. S6]QUD90992.1 hypothetical protein KCG34_25505 [Caulobacter sp. S6]